MNDKITAIYGHWDPNRKGVEYVGIQTATTPPYVWSTYLRTQDKPNSTTDLIVIPLVAAKNIFNFVPGKISEVKTRTLDEAVNQ